MLERGLLTLSEAAELACVSRQSLHAWCRRRGVDWKSARSALLLKQWEKAERPRKRKPSKARLRKQADEAKVEWDLNHEQPELVERPAEVEAEREPAW